MTDEKTKLFSAMRERTQENIARQKPERTSRTPSMNDIRSDWVRDKTRNFDEYTVGRTLTSEQEYWGELFDRWLAAHEQKVRAEAWEAAGRLVGEPTDEQVERAAKALRDDKANRTDLYIVPRWEDTPYGDKLVFRGQARAALTAAYVAPQAPTFISENGCEQPFHSIRAFFLQEGFFNSQEHHERVARAGDLARGLISVMITTPQPVVDGERNIATIAGRRGGKRSQMVELLLELAAERGLDVQLAPPVFDVDKIAGVIDAHLSGYTRNSHTHRAWWGCACGERGDVDISDRNRWLSEHRTAAVVAHLTGTGSTELRFEAHNGETKEEETP